MFKSFEQSTVVIYTSQNASIRTKKLEPKNDTHMMILLSHEFFLGKTLIYFVRRVIFNEKIDVKQITMVTYGNK